MKYQMIEYQKKINELRMLRLDLDEKTIAGEVKKIVSWRPSCTVLSVLRGCIENATKGTLMPWEIENENQNQNSIAF